MSKPFFLFLITIAIVTTGIMWYLHNTYRTPVAVDAYLDTEKNIVDGVSENSIPAISEPTFEPVYLADVYLDNAGYGIVVEQESQVRFYPHQILVWHEAVNDYMGSRSILVSYDPLTQTSSVYDRLYDEIELTFSVSGKRWNSNSLFYDSSTQSLWSQMLGEAIEGDLTSAQLQRLPSRVMTWTAFKTAYPYGQVLSRNTGWDRDYTQDPYTQQSYYESADIWFPLSHEDERLYAKSLVLGLERQGVFMAFPVDSLDASDTIPIDLDETDILQPSYWFAWAAMHPETQIYLEN